MSTNKVPEKEVETAEEGRSTENTEVGKTSSTAAVKEQALSNNAKAKEKAPTTEVRKNLT